MSSSKKVRSEASIETRPSAREDSERRHDMIAEAAYFIALERGCGGGDCAVEDWLRAEIEIDARLAAEGDAGCGNKAGSDLKCQ